MFQTFLGVAPIDGVYWTLSCELSFYIMMGVILHYKQTERIEYFCLLWLILIMPQRFFGVTHFYRLSLLSLYYFGQFFICGICLYRLLQKQSKLTVLVLLLALVT